MDEMARNDELAALRERVEVLEDALRYVFQRLVEAEGAVLQTHERLSMTEAAWEKARDLLREITTAVEFLLKRGGKPPGPAAPLSGVN
jgi:chromosome segregation ATPase